MMEFINLWIFPQLIDLVRIIKLITRLTSAEFFNFRKLRMKTIVDPREHIMTRQIVRRYIRWIDVDSHWCWRCWRWINAILQIKKWKTKTTSFASLQHSLSLCRLSKIQNLCVRKECDNDNEIIIGLEINIELEWRRRKVTRSEWYVVMIIEWNHFV